MIFEELTEFRKDLKALLKKYRSLNEDLAVVKKILSTLPEERPPFSFRIDNLGIETCVIKVKKITCKALKGRGVNSGLRLVYAYFEKIDPKMEAGVVIAEGRAEKIVMVELYHKNSQANENRDRIKKHFTNPISLMKKADAPIIVTETFSTPLSEVWAALTESDQMTQWYFEQIPSFRAEVGFETEFPVQSGDRTFTHRWKLTEVIPYQQFTHTWTYLEYPGHATVTFELTEVDGQTTVKLTLVVLADFPQDIPEFQRESCIGGWNYFLGERLKGYLAKKGE